MRSSVPSHIPSTDLPLPLSRCQDPILFNGLTFRYQPLSGPPCQLPVLKQVPTHEPTRHQTEAPSSAVLMDHATKLGSLAVAFRAIFDAKSSSQWCPSSLCYPRAVKVAVSLSRPVCMRSQAFVCGNCSPCIQSRVCTCWLVSPES